MCYSFGEEPDVSYFEYIVLVLASFVYSSDGNAAGVDESPLRLYPNQMPPNLTPLHEHRRRDIPLYANAAL